MHNYPRKIALIGATGSIGGNALAVLRKHPDKLRLVAAASGSNASGLGMIAREFKLTADQVSLFKDDGMDGLLRLVTRADVDIVLLAASGSVCLQPALAAIQAGKTLALANKEILVMGGHHVMQAAQKHGTLILPVDSEHNAIFQCLEGGRKQHLRKLILTASGGPFRELSLEQMARVTPADALRHPNWSMGTKITVDSATMANKGLEMIEARWLFDVAADAIEVVIHPQSIVHSMVEWVDGSIVAQLSPPSMTFAIQHCLLYPERAEGVEPTLDFSKRLALEFSPPDCTRFRCLELARQALRTDNAAPIVFNAANEIAVAAFLENHIPFVAIAQLIEHSLNMLSVSEPETLDDTFRINELARSFASRSIADFAS